MRRGRGKIAQRNDEEGRGKIAQRNDEEGERKDSTEE